MKKRAKKQQKKQLENVGGAGAQGASQSGGSTVKWTTPQFSLVGSAEIDVYETKDSTTSREKFLVNINFLIETVYKMAIEEDFINRTTTAQLAISKLQELKQLLF